MLLGLTLSGLEGQIQSHIIKPVNHIMLYGGTQPIRPYIYTCPILTFLS